MKLERFFNRPWIIIGVISLITLFFALQLPKIELDNDVLHFIPADHPEKIAFENMDELYGTDLTIVVGLQARTGTILDAAGITYIEILTGIIEDVPGVSDVTSLTNTEYIDLEDGGITSGPLVEDFSGTDREIMEIQRRLASWAVYDGSLVSEDLSATQIVVSIETGQTVEEREHIYLSIKDTAEELAGSDYRVYIAGEPVLTLLMSTNMQEDVFLLIPLVILTVVSLLFIFFRRSAGVVLPMVPVLVSTVWTIGLMALLGIKLSMVATVIPVLMVAMGSADGIHIVNHYFSRLQEQGVKAGYREVLFQVIREVGQPVFLTSVTTFIGFGALSVSQVVPMRDFGIFTALGVVVAFLVTITLIPALILVWPRPLQTASHRDQMEKRTGFLIAIYRFFAGSRIRVIVVTLLVIAVAGWGSSLLIVDNELIAYFKSDTEIRKADEFLRENFLGTRSFNINVIGEGPAALTDPGILRAMDDLARHLERRYPEVSKVLSYSDLIKRMNQVLNADIPSPYNDIEDKTETVSETESLVGAEVYGGEGFRSDGFEAEGFGVEGFSVDGFSVEGFMEEPAVDSIVADGSITDSSAAADFPYEDLIRIMNEALALAEGSTLSANDLVRLVNRRTNYQGAAYYEIPTDPTRYPVETEEELSNLIAQYLLLYSGNLNSWSDNDLEPSQARMSVQILTTGNRFTEELISDIEEYADRCFPPGYRLEIAGEVIVEQTLTNLITSAQIRSILISLSLVFIVMSITFRSLVAGIYGVIPLGLTLLVNFGIMGFAGIPLDISTAMVASIAIGIGIDYAIHFLTAYHRERSSNSNLDEVEIGVLSTTGRAIIFNALSVGAGFAVLAFSAFNPLMYMGILIALTMVTSSIASLTLLPVLLDVFKPRFIQPQEEQGGQD